MRLALPALLALAACDGERQAPPARPITIANPYHDALLKAEELPRFATIRATIDRNGQPCRTVRGAAAQGDYENLKFWVVRCANERGGTYLYGLFLGPEGDSQVRSCESIPRLNAATPGLNLPTCRPELIANGNPATSAASGD